MKKNVVIATLIIFSVVLYYLYINNAPTPSDKKNFDYYVFAQGILPETCLNSVNATKAELILSPQSCYVIPKNASILSLHGLWPSNFTKHQPDPAYCRNIPFDFETLSLDTRKKLNQYYGSVSNRIAEHEWYKHGTCDGSSQQEYFDKVIKYYEKTQAPAKIITDATGGTLSYDEIVAAYQKSGAGSISLECKPVHAENSQYLTQVLSSWNTDGTPLTYQEPGKQCAKDKAIRIGEWPTYFDFYQYSVVFNKQYPNPTAVGFDIDDTVLASSPGFYYLKNFANIKPGDPGFWDKMNNGLDEFSLPKEIAKKLIAMHKKRCDTIYFITKRGKSETEMLTKIVGKVFNLEQVNPVIFTNLESKVEFIKSRSIKVYYGDADADMIESRQAGAQAVRIIRNDSSLNLNQHINGQFGETVILGSDR